MPDQTNTAEAVELGRIGNDPVEHDLKCWPEYYQAIADGRKMHEVRQNDRDFRVGDRLRLHEWDPVTRRASGRQLVRSVTYIGTWDQKPGNVVMSLAPPELDRLRSRIMELEKALGPSQEQRNAENLVAIREAIIVREIRMRTEQLRFDAANPDFGDRYQREVAAALADQFDEFADSLEAAPPPASLPRG